MLFSRTLFSLLPLVSGLPAEQKLLQEDSLSPFHADFDKYVLQVLEHFHVPGLSVAVIDGNRTWAKVRYIYSLTCTSLSC